MHYQAIFFDFDGVILDSVHVKTRAFAAMFRQYGPQIEQAVIDYHLAHGGVSRFSKFEYYYTRLLKKTIDHKTMNALCREFNSLVLQGVLDSPYVPGALETLNFLKYNNIPAFVVSGTPDDEIKYIVKIKSLAPYFLEVHGSPRQKSEIILDVSQRHKLPLDKTLFIGDAMTDYSAAQACGGNFLGIVNPGSPSPFPSGTLISASVTLAAGR
ncbi:HAD family hydrolase [Desulfolutivibrio sulfoxidireducens]|uniref:HAD family hydrolase n=1 Tax=Desulfolutivibrio sulfoxidireducens TaxID=2773299 RepID=UPI00159DB2F0|nr:HAD family hydrolase [Desulfolutivibrio sulfoxidireducens]QLA18864.1 HAD hydrolase-like protein [Desulfolutivibrio sulfoxidireducens]